MKAAVIGLGYVGLPLTIRLSQIGLAVTAIDKDKNKIGQLKKFKLPFAKEEPNLANFFTKSKKSNLIRFFTQYSNLNETDIIFVCVDTPIKKFKPNYKSLISVIKKISKNLKKGQIIVIESTIAPKTSENVVIPLIESLTGFKINKDFFLAVAPERIRPNYIFKQLTSLPRIVGVSSKQISPVLKKIYSKITSGEINITNILTAEAAKTVENTYRDVQIAFANEIALACEELGVNVWEVRNLVNKDPFKNIHEPGSGVGGHCIPKDPWLFASAIKSVKLKLIENARFINDHMPNHVLELINSAIKEKKITTNFKIAIIGYSFVQDSDDTRNSPTKVLTNLLDKRKYFYKIHDPFVFPFKKDGIDYVIKDSDILVVMVAHTMYKSLKLSKIARLMRTKIIVDGRNLFEKGRAESAGFLYKGIGNV